MKLLFLDFETQGSDAATTNPTEVGASQVRSLGEGKYERIASISQLIWEEGYPNQTDEIIELTGITDDMLRQEGHDPTCSLEALGALIEDSDIVLAHNKMFDETVYRSTCARLGIPAREPKNGWLCTIQDVAYAKKYKCKKLAHLAYDHGILVHPDTLHRALDDVKLLEMLITMHYPVEELIAYRDTPWVFLKAVTLAPWTDGGASNALAKKLGYSYEKVWGTEKPVFPKTWVKRAKENALEAEKTAASAVGLDIKRLVLN